MLRIGLASALGPGAHFCFADFLTADPGSIHVVHNNAAVAARLRVPQYHSLRCAFTTFAHKRLLCYRNLCIMSALPDRSTEAAKHLRTRTHTRSTPAFILLSTLLQFFNSICSCYSEYNMQDGARDPNKLRYLSKRVSSPRFERALPRCRARTPARARPIPRPNCAHIRPPLAPP